MSHEEQERRRLERLRQQQINSRDPGPSKIRGYDWGKHAQTGAKRKQQQQKPLLAELFGVFPGRWKGLLIGLALSLVPTLLIVALLPYDFRVLALLPPLVLGIPGYILGKITENHYS